MGAISFNIEEGLIELLAKKLPLEVFVETGTFKGDTLEVASKYFSELYSVEMSPELYQAAAERFRSQPNMHLNLGGSPDFLREHKEVFRSSAVLFWLDAHWCAADDTAGSDSQSPLLSELEAIRSLHPSSVLLIDDARLYLSTPPKPHRLSDWPDFHEVVLTLLALSSEHRLLVYNDVVVFYPKNIRADISDYAHKCGEDQLLLAHDARKQRRKKRRKKNRWWRRS